MRCPRHLRAPRGFRAQILRPARIDDAVSRLTQRRPHLVSYEVHCIVEPGLQLSFREAFVRPVTLDNMGILVSQWNTDIDVPYTVEQFQVHRTIYPANRAGHAPR
jgi:hypothetical protein